MLSRAAVRASGAARAAMRVRCLPTPLNCSTVPVPKKDDAALEKPADVSFDGPLIRYGLTDWRLSVPLGVAAAIPFLANEWIILSEETQLVAAFALFCTMVYKYAGGAIAKSLDDRQAAIISEINKLEEKEVKLFKEQIEEAKLLKSITEDVTFLNAHVWEFIEKRNQTKQLQKMHETRHQFVRWLESTLALEKAEKKDRVDEFLRKTAQVVAQNFRTKEELKRATVDQVIAALKDPSKAEEPQEDLVSAEYEKVAQQLWKEIVEKKSQADEATKAQLQAQMKALKGKPAEQRTPQDEDAEIKLLYHAMKAGLSPSELFSSA